MRITYLHHSGFFVELPGSCWLFDYETGAIPAFDARKPLYVCVSHSHPDHFNREIFRLFGARESATFLLARQIRHPGWEAYGVPESRMVRLAPNRCYELPDGSVQTVNSTDAGVAFAVQSGGRRFYHAGDLHWWSWPDDTPEQARVMKQRFFCHLEKLRGQHFDAAFVPLDPRLEENFALGFDAVMRTLEIDCAFPMHMWDDPDVIARLRRLACSAPYRDRVVVIPDPRRPFVWQMPGSI